MNSNKPHCYGKMIWILKYPLGQIPQTSLCSCGYQKPCLELTREYSKKVDALLLWIKNIRKEELIKIKTQKTVCVHTAARIPEVFTLDYPEKLTEGYFKKFPDTKIILTQGA